MKVVDFSRENTILNRYVAELRDVNIQSDRMRYRRNVERVGEIIAYEISRSLPYCGVSVTTPLGVSEINVPSVEPVLATILRAGLPLHQGFLNIFDRAENAFVSAYREYINENDFDIIVEYIASPSIEGKTLIIIDPMLATGNSLELSYRALLDKGTPSALHIASVIASDEAIENLKRIFEGVELTVWCGAIDPSLNAHGYIVPGLGDAGDLCYGGKL